MPLPRLLIVWLLALSVAPAWAERVQVGVYLDFEQSPSLIAADAMRAEATGDLRQLGFEIVWRLVSENRGTEAFENLVVVRMSGMCACGGFLQQTREILILGSTAVTDGRVLPYSQVRCDDLRRVLPNVEFSSDRPHANAALGRAMGRVLAHELYHVLKGTTHHAATGIAKAVQSTDDLTSDEFSFELLEPLTAHGALVR